MSTKIYVVGMMGSDRVSLAKKIAEEKNLPFMNLDKEIEKKDGRSIKKIAMMMGEHAYHEGEYQKLLELDNLDKDFVLACGDGVLFDSMCDEIIEKGQVYVADWDKELPVLFENAILDESLPYAFLDMLRMEERLNGEKSKESREKAFATFENFHNDRKKYFTKYITKENNNEK